MEKPTMPQGSYPVQKPVGNAKGPVNGKDGMNQKAAAMAAMARRSGKC